ncbi:DNA-binding IclR family transcriptional regulator [Bacillus pakistanensis]|uniref:DNA-binding IclR family transcriptional regulator n=1 Tax=Rossellomorea pakistanensis TaxID=992288 RepID=A0ABS2NC61_9BACI|nr:IclR family transcriptional regulator [Bacillus pakistanensis]MBM7585449.1 DNA-binding IclR family transcriptional regulator [Bacillus pakistanensis]
MVQSIDRAMQIIQILISNPHKMDWSITELAEQTDLPLSTMHRLLSSLVDHGLVMQNPTTKHYKAGYLWMEIGLKVLDSIDFRTAALPVMESLAMEVEESIYLNIQDGAHGITIEIVDSPLKVRIAETLGIRSPLYIGAPNKAILFYLNDEEREQIYRRLDLTKEVKDALKTQISEVRKVGYAISEGERTEGTSSVAAPVFGYANKVLAAVSINAPSFRFTEDRLPVLIEKVKQAAQDISVRIGKFH